MTVRTHQHRERVRALGCIICRREHRGYVPAAIHHCRFSVGMSQRAGDEYAIPLATPIHQLGMMTPEWPWQDDVPIHAGGRPFMGRYGVYEQELLTEVCDLLEVEYPPALQKWYERRIGHAMVRTTLHSGVVTDSRQMCTSVEGM